MAGTPTGIIKLQHYCLNSLPHVSMAHAFTVLFCPRRTEQGANHVLAELRQLYFTYPETQEYVQKMARIVHAQSKTPEALKIGLHTNGMNILEWLDDETKAPSEDYLLMYVARHGSPLVAAGLAGLLIGVARVFFFFCVASARALGCMAAIAL
jgi:hypothetical protein